MINVAPSGPHKRVGRQLQWSTPIYIFFSSLALAKVTTARNIDTTVAGSNLAQALMRDRTQRKRKKKMTVCREEKITSIIYVVEHVLAKGLNLQGIEPNA